MENKKTVEALNKLIIINNDRIEGYETASDESEESDLKTLFSKFISTSQKCKQELIMEVKALGGKVDEGTKTTGKFFRKWMDVKAALTGRDRVAILNSCEFGEDRVLETYDEVIEDESEYLSAKQKNMVVDQRSLLKKDRDRVIDMRNSLAGAS